MQIRNGSLLSSLRAVGQRSLHNASKAVNSGKKVAGALSRSPLVQLINKQLNSSSPLPIPTSMKTVKDERQNTAELESESVGNSSEPLTAEEQLQQEQLAKELAFKRAPINWIPAAVLIATPIAAAVITPWYLATHEVSKPVWITFGAVAIWTGMSITTGYHRLMSHRTYKAHPAVRNFFLLGATLAVQGSAFDW